MNMFHHFLKIFSFLILALVFSILGSIVLDKAKAWVEAPAAPPGYGILDPNDFKPVSKGKELGTETNPYQLKTGKLGISTIGDGIDTDNGPGPDFIFNPGIDIAFGLTVGQSGQMDDGIKVSGISYFEDGNVMINNTNSKLCFGTDGTDCQSSWAGSSYWTKTGNDIYYNTGNVGIGTPGGLSAKLRVAGGGIKVDGASEFYDTVALFGPAPYLYAGSSSGAGQYGYLWWDDAIKLIRMGHQSVGGAGIAVDNTGNVGIGTTSLSKKLTVAGEIQLDGYPTGLYLGNGQSFFDDGGGGLNIASGATLTLSSGGNIILTGDNVGIGEVSPTAKLHLVGVDTTNSNFALKAVNSSASPLLFVRNDGYVGIGTAGPGYKLDVTGTFRATGAATFGDMVGLFSAAAAQLYLGSSSGAGQYGIIQWDDTGKRLDFTGTQGQGVAMTIKNGNVGIGTTTPQAKLEVGGAVILGNTFADQIRMNGKLIYGGMARSYGIFLNGKIYCGSGINFDQYSFECKYPVVDILSPVMESGVPIPMEFARDDGSPNLVDYRNLNIICSTLGGKYLSHTITGSTGVGNYLRAYENTIVGESVGSKTVGWRSMNNSISPPDKVRFGNVSCSYDFHY